MLVPAVHTASEDIRAEQNQKVVLAKKPATVSWKNNRQPIVDSVDQEVLDSGVVGHFPGTGPVGVGNYALIGHVVTHGEPFAKLPSLTKGDKVVVDNGTVYTFKVTEKFVVDHTDLSVLGYEPKTLTLITCNSRWFRTDERLVVRAVLEE